MPVLLALAVLCIAGSVFIAADAALLPARERRASVRRALGVPGAPAADEPAQPGFRARVLQPLGPRLARLALRATPSASLESVGARLLAAGYSPASASRFLALKAGAALGGIVLGLLLASSGGAGVGIALGVALAGVGFIAPDFVVNARARRRREAAETQLPDALDLLAVSVEAGLGFDAAVAKLTEYLEGPLIDELGLALSEMRIGRGRQEALRRLAERLDTPGVTAFVRAVVQADQLGISLGRMLRVQADDARKRRQTAAEEKAMKAPVKMLFPTVLFIFPAMFLVILGPAMLNLAEVFGQ